MARREYVKWAGRGCASVLAAAAILAGCGYVGDPLPPSLNIPTAVSDLKAVERGPSLVVSFTISGTTTDGVLLRRLGKVDLRVGPGGAPPFDVEKWAAAATPVPNDIAEPGPVQLEVPAKQWAGREVIVGVRAAGPKGRFSRWSNLVAVTVVAPLEEPSGLKAESAPQGVRLDWSVPRKPPGLAFRVFRRTEQEKTPALVGRSDSTEYVDASAQYGTAYIYTVQSMLKAGESEAESDISAPLQITPVDRFPPAVPAGLSAIPSVQSIELSWDRNTEPDLKGYYVYRAAGNGPFERVGELLPTPNYSDRHVQPGTRYRYAVSAVDQSGNESARSAPIEVVAPSNTIGMIHGKANSF